MRKTAAPPWNVFQWARAEILRAAWRRGLYLPGDRRVLTADILPELARDPAVMRILFVGAQWYTARYAESFEGKTFATIDPDPNAARFGGATHAVGRIQDLAHHFPGAVFDAIVMTGVIGYGLNERADVDLAIAACAAALRPGGWLVLGVNELLPTYVDPAASPASRAFMAEPFGRRASARIDIDLPFKERRHTFVFWRRVVS